MCVRLSFTVYDLLINYHHASVYNSYKVLLEYLYVCVCVCAFKPCQLKLH